MADNNKTRHEQAKAYELKSKIVGTKLKFNYLPNDDVELAEIFDKNSTGKIVIPSFITKIQLKYVGVSIVSSPFTRCKFTDIFIDNPPDIEFDAASMCYAMRSESIRLSFRHPEMVVNMADTFLGCINVVNIDISDVCRNSVKI